MAKVGVFVCGAVAADARVRKCAQWYRNAGHSVEYIEGVVQPQVYERAVLTEVCGELDDIPKRFLHMIAWEQVATQTGFDPRRVFIQNYDMLHVHEYSAMAYTFINKGKECGDPGLPVVADLHEYERGRRMEAKDEHYRAERVKVEAAALPHAAAVVTVSEPIAERLREEHGLERVWVVPNAVPNWSASDLSLYRKRMLGRLSVQGHANKKRVGFLGNIVPGRRLEELCRETKGSDWDVVLVGCLHASMAHLLKEEHVLRLPGPYGGSWPYAYSGTRSRPHHLDAIACCHVGWNGVDHGVESYRMAAPNKLYEYMAAGLQIVSNRQAPETMKHSVEWDGRASTILEMLEEAYRRYKHDAPLAASHWAFEDLCAPQMEAICKSIL